MLAVVPRVTRRRRRARVFLGLNLGGRRRHPGLFVPTAGSSTAFSSSPSRSVLCADFAAAFFLKPANAK